MIKYMKSLSIVVLSISLLILMVIVGIEIYDLVKGDLVSKDIVNVFSKVDWSFYPILFLKNAVLLFLLIFFISEYKINQRQYFQYKFKKNVANSLISVEDRYKEKDFSDDLSKISLDIYKDIIYSEPQWDKKSIKKEVKENKKD